MMERRTVTPPRTADPLAESGQRRVAATVQAIAFGETAGMRDILAVVTLCGSKGLLPAIAAARLTGTGVVNRVC